MTLLSVRHITRYTYKAPVRLGDHRLMCRPRDSFDQRLIEFRLDILPQPKDVRWLHDTFGNCIAVANFTCEADQLVFDTKIVLDHEPTHGPEFLLESRAGSGCLNSSPRKLSGFLPGYAECGAWRF
jgi:hypothetical protein